MRRFAVVRVASCVLFVLILSIALLSVPPVHAARVFDPTVFDAARLDLRVTADGGVTLPQALSPWLGGRTQITPEGALV